MTQPNPTRVAHASDSAPACSCGAGRHPSGGQAGLEAEEQIRTLLGDARAQESDFYLDNFSPGERKELSAAAQKTLDAEVVMLRSAMKRFFQAVRSDEKPETIERLGDALKLLGLSCTRLGNVLKINQALQGAAKQTGQSDLLEKIMGELAVISMEEEKRDEA